MRFAGVVAVFILCLRFAFAGVANKNVVLEVSIKRGTFSHRYLLLKSESKSQDYELTLTDEKQKTKSQTISHIQAEKFVGDATRVVWDEKYRKQDLGQKCHEYATIKTESGRTIICQEDKVLVGQTLGLLNSLQASFK